MKRNRQGSVLLHRITGEPFEAFIPAALPPAPTLQIEGLLRNQLSSADQMLGRLDGLSTLIRHPDMLITFYIRKEGCTFLADRGNAIHTDGTSSF